MAGLPAQYTIHITVTGRYQRWVDPAGLRAAARSTLRQAGAPAGAALSVLVTGDAALREFNRDFLGDDHVTDVLAFPASEIDPETGRLYLGDVALAYPRASAQAKLGGHPVRAELQLLTVHGVLHLLGHDHATAADRQRMWAAQAAVLKRLRIPMRAPEA